MKRQLIIPLIFLFLVIFRSSIMFNLTQSQGIYGTENTDREFRFEPGYVKDPIDPNVVWHLFETVRTHLTADWEGGIQHGLERGWLI